jgi:hydrogenase nickel incorporation protein HypB
MIDKSVTAVNDAVAHQIEHFLEHKGVFCINLLGSPGSGKTSVIEQLAKHIPSSEIAVIQGDLESDVDKIRLERSGIYTYQINTHSGCHLNAMMINGALLEMKLDGIKYLIIENVGNLVCPAGVKIGQVMNLVVSSVTEGSDKPRKYPYIFMDADIILISKSDLSAMVDFDAKQYLGDIKLINSHAKIFDVSTRKPESFSEVAHFISHVREHFLNLEHEHSHSHGETEHSHEHLEEEHSHDEVHSHETNSEKIIVKSSLIDESHYNVDHVEHVEVYDSEIEPVPPLEKESDLTDLSNSEDEVKIVTLNNAEEFDNLEESELNNEYNDDDIEVADSKEEHQKQLLDDDLYSDEDK